MYLLVVKSFSAGFEATPLQVIAIIIIDNITVIDAMVLLC